MPLRKPGKLPWETITETYSLEYGTDALEMHIDGITSGEKVLIVDDVIATGGTAAAAVNLLERAGGKVVGVSVFIELGFLHGREQSKECPSMPSSDTTEPALARVAEAHRRHFPECRLRADRRLLTG